MQIISESEHDTPRAEKSSAWASYGLNEIAILPPCGTPQGGSFLYPERGTRLKGRKTLRPEGR